jgi:hypothetical protein
MLKQSHACRRSRLPIEACHFSTSLAHFIALSLALVLMGCSVDHPSDMVMGPTYAPSNVHHDLATLPRSLQRVAVLPLCATLDPTSAASARDVLQPVLMEELAKSKRFEIVLVKPEDLEHRTGRPSWTAEDKLPANFLKTLGEDYACEAVLFPQITVYRAYPPLAIGWRLKLVTVHGCQMLWAADEVFDAGHPSVLNGARLYEQQEFRAAGPINDSKSGLNSPRRFGHYSAATLLATLPQR